MHRSSNFNNASICSITHSKSDPKAAIHRLIKWQKPQISAALKPHDDVYKDSKINPKLVRKSSMIEQIIHNNNNRYSITAKKVFFDQKSFLK